MDLMSALSPHEPLLIDHSPVIHNERSGQQIIMTAVINTAPWRALMSKDAHDSPPDMPLTSTD
jgi:hypothetical protein